MYFQVDNEVLLENKSKVLKSATDDYILTQFLYQRLHLKINSIK